MGGLPIFSLLSRFGGCLLSHCGGCLFLALAEVSPHLHVVRCHASLIENAGGTHCRLLLCDPCSGLLRPPQWDNRQRPQWDNRQPPQWDICNWCYLLFMCFRCVCVCVCVLMCFRCVLMRLVRFKCVLIRFKCVLLRVRCVLMCFY